LTHQNGSRLRGTDALLWFYTDISLSFSKSFPVAPTDLISGSTDIVRADENGYKVEKQPEYFSYYIKGRLIDQINGIVKVGGLLFEFERKMLPGDRKEGESFILLSEII
jgi:hypothetical protein